MKCLWLAKIHWKTVWSKFDSYPSKYPNWVPHLGTRYFQLTHKNILSKKENFTSIICGSSTVKFWCRNCGNIENNVKMDFSQNTCYAYISIKTAIWLLKKLWETINFIKKYSNVFQLSHEIKSLHWNKFYQFDIHTV